MRMAYGTMTLDTDRSEPQLAAAAAPTAASPNSPARKVQAVITKVSIVIPVYNEEATIQHLVGLVVAAPLPGSVAREIVVVNDCSSDGTATKLDQLKDLFPAS
jgi:cellulose synthase/poly-beta-1,6-N-acetylglucosamine synthase-like glycosyltransferase